MAEPVKVKRIKVRRTHTRKLFFEKTLMDWKDSTEDRNFRSVLFRAYLNLRNYPLEIMSITELKSIKGIGELIATKLDAAWDCICSNYLSIPTLKQIKELRKGECLQFISSAPQRFSAPCVPDSDTLSNNLAAAVVQPATSTLTSKTTISPKKGRPRGPRKHARKVLTSDDAPSSTIHSTNILDTSPLRARKRPTNKVPVASTATNKKPRKREPKYSMMEEAASAGLLIMAPHGSFPSFASLADKPNISSAECAMRNPRGGVLQSSIKSNAQLSTFGEVTSQNNDDGMLSYYAFDFGKSEVLLLVDNREHRGGRAGGSICDHLRNMDVNFELRTLSIGDYVWIIRMKDGAEMMLDYIVERKTLDDMTQSIRSSRYYALFRLYPDFDSHCRF
ncbi:unnamed protein product [Toxocara canis]|uniref:Crossover junction endonuclease MUS81 n=1 Tax=Toxocara canis TaxID=6265 RepID=A0A183U4G0_TOXCA|nr:unnamed protein product [Toxocara canis]